MDEVAYSSGGCTWWGDAAEAYVDLDGVSRCPICRRTPVFKTGREQWNNAITDLSIAFFDSDYGNFVRWLKGKCFSDPDKARKRYGEVKRGGFFRQHSRHNQQTNTKS